jgi:hypothetical protein
VSYIKQKDEGVPADNIEGTIAPDQVAFGDPVNSGKIKGSDNFTFVDESGGNGPTVQMTGDKPVLKLQDDTDATTYRTELLQSGASMYVNHKDSTGTNNELLRLAAGTVIVNDETGDIDFRVAGTSSQSLLRTNAAQNNVGIGTNPSSDVEALHVKGTGSDDTMVRIESTDDDADAGPVIDLYRNAGVPVDNDLIGKITFSGNDDGGGKNEYARIRSILRDSQAGGEEGAVIFEATTFGNDGVEYLRYGTDPAQSAREVVVNDGSTNYIKFRVESDSNEFLLVTDPNAENVGIGTAPDSAVQRLHVDGDSADTSTTDPTVLIENDASGRTFTALELKNKSDDADSSVTFRMTSLSQTDSDFEITHDSFGGTTFITGQPDTVTRRNLVMSNTIFNVNADQSDIDTQIESVGVAAMFKVDAANNNIGIGTEPDSAYERLHVKGSGLTDMVVFEGTSEGSGSTDGPDLILYNSATPTGPNKFIGRFEWRGKDDAGSAVSYCSIQGFIQDETAGTTDGLLLLKTQTGSSQLEKIRLDQNGVKINETGNSGVNLRVKTSNSGTQQDFFRTYNSATVENRYTEVLRGSRTITATPVSITADRCYGSNIVLDTGASVVNLPEAIPGMHLQVVNKNISGTSVAPATGETINGSTSAYSIHHGWVIAKVICVADGEWVLAEAF